MRASRPNRVTAPRARPRAGALTSLVLAALLIPSCSTRDVSCEVRPEFLAVGEQVADLVLTNGEGLETSVSELIDGKVALVDLWATWCAPCIVALPHLEQMHERYADRGFTVVGVMVDGKARKIGPDFVKEREIGYPILFDDNGQQTACEWGEVLFVPTMMLVDRDGTVIEVHQGTGDLTAFERKLAEIFDEPAGEPESAVL